MPILWHSDQKERKEERKKERKGTHTIWKLVIQVSGEYDYSLLICQFFIDAETVSFSCALDLLLKYGKIQLIWRNTTGEEGEDNIKIKAVTCFLSCKHMHAADY